MTERQLEPTDFEGAQLAQMRAWVQNGSGSEGLFEKATGWNNEDQYLRDLQTRLEEKLKSVGAVMKSESGEAMQNQALPIVLWTGVTADNAKLQSEQMTQQGQAFSKVRSSIPAKGEEQAVPDDTWIEEGWDSFWTGSTDAEDAKAHNEKLRQEAVQAFTAYQDATQSNVAGSAVFTAPPDGGVMTDVSSSSGPSVGGVGSPSPSSTSSAWAGGSGAGGGSYAGSGAGAGGAYGGGAYGGGSAGTGAAWANMPGGGGSGQNAGGGAGRVPGGPGAPGYPGGAPGLGGAPGAGARPGAGSGAGGRGGAGGAAGRGLGAGSGAGAGAGGRAGGPGMGAGGRAGMGGLGGAAGSGVAGAGGAAGRGGAAGAGAAGARGRGQEGEDDLEHETPDYLVGDQGVFDEDLPKVAPPVFGDWDNQR